MEKRPFIAEDFITVAKSPDPENIYMGSPAIIKLSNGRLLITYDHFSSRIIKLPRGNQLITYDHPDVKICGYVMISDDNGKTWRETLSRRWQWATPFEVGNEVYIIACSKVFGDIVICKSKDKGETWSDFSTLFEGPYHTAPTSIVFKNGKIYKAFERNEGKHYRDFTSMVIVGDLSGDLTDPNNWKMSNAVTYPGNPSFFKFGLYNPNTKVRAGLPYWLEGNVVEVKNEIKVLLRVETGGIPNIAAVETLNEENLKLSFDFFIPFPGGQCKFFIQYDSVSGYYWMTANQVTDHLRDPLVLRKKGFKGLPYQERRILNLYYSLDALNWFYAGTIAMSKNIMEAFSYPSFTFDNNDILVLSRTSINGKNQHDTNMITLHKVRQFRSLALDLKPVL